MAQCPDHKDHINRIEKLEANMDRINEERVSAGRYLALAAFLGTIGTAMMGFAGTLLGFAAKAWGWL